MSSGQAVCTGPSSCCIQIPRCQRGNNVVKGHMNKDEDLTQHTNLIQTELATAIFSFQITCPTDLSVWRPTIECTIHDVHLYYYE